MVQSFSAGGLNDRNPFFTWRTVLAEAFIPLDCDAISANPFSGRVEQAEIGAMSVSRLKAGAHQVRCVATRDRDFGENVFLNLQLTGRGQTVARGHRVCAGRFDLALADPSEGYVIRNETPFDLISFTLPRQCVPPQIIEQRGLLMSSTQETQTLARLLINYADLALHGVEGGQYLSIETAVTDLLVVAAQRLMGNAKLQQGPETRAQLIADYISDNSQDPLLSIGRVAALFGITPRYVNKLLSRLGQSFGDLLLASRLERARDRLLGVDPPLRTITQIAFECGFSELSHFSRTFRHRFGETPSEFRERNRRSGISH